MLDHCTLWPDKFLGVYYGNCCLAHDIAYEFGLPKFPADLALGKCVAAHGLPVMGLVMAIGTGLFGWFFYRQGKRR